MKERQIIFGAPMVRAILSGRKTVTRRVVSLVCGLGRVSEVREGSRGFAIDVRDAKGCVHSISPKNLDDLSPYGEPGDRLWVKETFQPFWADSEIRPENRWKDGPDGYRINYVADSGPEPCEHEDDLRLTPSIYMPRWASRITLEVVSVRVERLHEITAEDVCREGVEGDELESFPPQGDRKAFAKLWDAINAKRAPWVENPWVWRVEFKRVQ